MSTTDQELHEAIQKESEKFEEYYKWLEKAMSPAFFKEVSKENIILITRSLMGFQLQDYFSTINLKRAAIVICIDSDDADLKILQDYDMYGIKYYQAYRSSSAPPIPGITGNLRIATLYFTEAIETVDIPYPEELIEQLRSLVKKRIPEITDKKFDRLVNGINTRFLRALPLERLVIALEMFFKAKKQDNCQYTVHYNENWEEKQQASMQIILAWRNTPKHNFLFRMARIIQHQNLIIRRVNASYLDPYSPHSILLLAVDLHGNDGKAAWEVANLPEFLRELSTVKYFACFDNVNKHLVRKKLISRLQGNILRAMINFIHQALVNVDVHEYNIEKIEEDLCRHPELTTLLMEAFSLKFDPNIVDYEAYEKKRNEFLNDVNHLDTGNEENDIRRKNILCQGMNFIHHCLKTNAYRLNYTALSFRLDPKYLDDIPFNRKEKFPILPYAIFYFKGMHFFGFHIRFKDLARGGLRTVFPDQTERMELERNRVFAECYNLAYTQHQKNKDIPEGGAKGVLFLKPYDRLNSEALILENELRSADIHLDEVEAKVESFRKEQKLEFLHQAQRSYIESLITIINCDPDGKIRPKRIIDYWQRPEYIYLGPDENMHDDMIEWIAKFSKKYNYRPGGSFISGKSCMGINHKEFGVTSHGVNVFMAEVLIWMGIDPRKDPFTIKMSGGPDGDVAGNQIKNLHKYYSKTANLLALTDVSGTINDPKGLDLDILTNLFKEQKSINHYPPEKLHEGGFLVDKFAKRTESSYAQKTLCYRMKKGEIVEDWLSGSDMNHLIRCNVHKTKTDIFIPGGGRPRTLNINNLHEFLDETGKPTSKAIIEGANLYLTPKARSELENLGVLIVKDSSANKTGVICSSFEVLSGLTLEDQIFIQEKPNLVKEILDRIEYCAYKEVKLLLKTHQETKNPLTTISDEISARINQFTDQLLNYLENISLPKNAHSALIKSFLSYCLPTLKERYSNDLLAEIPDHHKKAIIASHIASELVYSKGLKWSPTIVDILPVLLRQEKIGVQ